MERTKEGYGECEAQGPDASDPPDKGTCPGPKGDGPTEIATSWQTPTPAQIASGDSASVIGSYRISELYNSAFPTLCSNWHPEASDCRRNGGRNRKETNGDPNDPRVTRVGGTLGRSAKCLEYTLETAQFPARSLYLPSPHRPFFFALVARANPSLPHFLLITVSLPHPSSVSRAVHPQDRSIPERGTSRQERKEQSAPTICAPISSLPPIFTHPEFIPSLPLPPSTLVRFSIAGCSLASFPFRASYNTCFCLPLSSAVRLSW